MKYVLRGRFIKILEKSHISQLTAHLKAIEKTEEVTHQRSRSQETIELRAKINKIETYKYQK